MDINPLDPLFGATEDPRPDPALPDTEATPEAPAPAAEPDRAPPPAERETVGFYKAMQEERDKRQAAEKRLAELEARTPPAAPPPPDEQHRIDAFVLRRDLSREFLVSRHGEELAATVETWAAERCGADPHFNQQMLAAKLPFEAAKAAYDRERILAEVKSPDDLAAFRAWRAEKTAPPAPVAQPQQPPPSPLDPGPDPDPAPKSLVNAPGTGMKGAAHVPSGEGAAYASLGL